MIGTVKIRIGAGLIRAGWRIPRIVENFLYAERYLSRQARWMDLVLPALQQIGQ